MWIIKREILENEKWEMDAHNVSLLYPKLP